MSPTKACVPVSVQLPRNLPPLIPHTAEALKKWGRVRGLFTHHGRIGRIRWLARALVCLVIPVPFCIAGVQLAAWSRHQAQEMTTAGTGEGLYSVLLLILLLVLTLFMGTSFVVSAYLGVYSTIRRLHDFNLSGWWSIPFFGLSAFLGIGPLLLLIIPGSKGANRFGSPEAGGLSG
jgi:uncharacterized membrane protein YhaH (DUF805 family)